MLQPIISALFAAGVLFCSREQYQVDVPRFPRRTNAATEQFGPHVWQAGVDHQNVGTLLSHALKGYLDSICDRNAATDSL